MKTLFFLIGMLALTGLVASPAMAGVVYNNDFGGVNSGDNFNENAWPINYTFSVADSFVLGFNATVTEVEFATWAFSGDNLQSVNWYITNSVNVDNPGSSGAGVMGNVIASGTVSPTENSSFTNNYGYDVLDETFSIPAIALYDGTQYWLQLDTAVVPSGNPIFWDQSDGPSLGYYYASFGISGYLPYDGAQCNGPCTGSESFILYGEASTIPEPGTVTLLGGGLLALAAFYRRK